MLGNQRFIGGNNMFTVLNGQLNQIVSHGGAAYQFHQHIHVRVSRHIEHIATDAGVPIIMIGVLSSRTDMTHHQRLSGAHQQRLALISQDAYRRQPHRANATDANI